MNASERRYARKLARRRTREVVAIRRAVARAEGGRSTLGSGGRDGLGGLPQPRTGG